VAITALSLDAAVGLRSHHGHPR